MDKREPKKQNNLTELAWDLQNLAELIDDQKHRTIEELRDRKVTKEQLLIELKEISEFTQNHTVGLVKKIYKYPSLAKDEQEVLMVITPIITIVEDAHSDIDLNESDKKKESLYSRFLRTFKRANDHRVKLEDLAAWFHNADSNSVKVVDRSKTNKRELSKHAKNALALRNYIIEKNPALADAKENKIYEQLEIIDLPEKLSEYKLPTCGTWKRNVREARSYYGISKNTPRAGRSSNIHTSKEIESINEITSQVVDEEQEAD